MYRNRHNLLLELGENKKKKMFRPFRRDSDVPPPLRGDLIRFAAARTISHRHHELAHKSRHSQPSSSRPAVERLGPTIRTGRCAAGDFFYLFHFYNMRIYTMAM